MSAIYITCGVGYSRSVNLPQYELVTNHLIISTPSLAQIHTGTPPQTKNFGFLETVRQAIETTPEDG